MAMSAVGGRRGDGNKALMSAAETLQTDFLTCKICRQPFSKPKTLTCLHTFCKTCLVEHTQRHGARTNDGATCVFCPLCTQVTDLPRAGVEGLRDNQLLTNLLNIVNSKSIQNCDLCRDDGETNPATYCCIKCEEFLCDECAKTHKRTRITRDHLVVNMGSMMDAFRSLQGKDQPSKINARLLTKFGRHSNTLHNPESICVNKADDILVSNDNDSIAVLSLSGTCKKVLEQKSFYSSETEHLIPNAGVDVTSEGYIAVAMRKGVSITPPQAHVAVIQSLAGREISVLTVKCKQATDCQPHGIVVTPNNHIAVSDVGRHCIYVFDPELRMVRQFGKRGSRGRRQFKGPRFLAATPGSDLVVSDYDNHCVKTFDLRGKPKLVIGRMGKRPGELMHPMGVCVDRYGNFFVADRDNHRVQMFDSRGAYTATILTLTCEDGHDVRPHDVTMTTYGHLAVLLRGIEGVDIAEVHIYQYGSVRPTAPLALPEQEDFDTVDTANSKALVPRRLKPLSPIAAGKKVPTTTPAPDLLPPVRQSKSQRYQITDDGAALAALYASTTGQRLPDQHRDQASHVCVIL